jgi:hypothetical protein
MPCDPAGMSGEHRDTSATGEAGRLPGGRDGRLDQVGQRARAAGLNAWWTQFRNPATGLGEGPYGMRVDLPSGSAFRSVNPQRR